MTRGKGDYLAPRSIYGADAACPERSRREGIGVAVLAGILVAGILGIGEQRRPGGTVLADFQVVTSHAGTGAIVTGPGRGHTTLRGSRTARWCSRCAGR